MITDYGTIKHLVRTAVREETSVSRFDIVKSKTQKHIRLAFVESELYTNSSYISKLNQEAVDRITKRLAIYNAEVSISTDWYIDSVQVSRLIVIIPLENLEMNS